VFSVDVVTLYILIFHKDTM